MVSPCLLSFRRRRSLANISEFLDSQRSVTSQSPQNGVVTFLVEGYETGKVLLTADTDMHDLLSTEPLDKTTLPRSLQLHVIQGRAQQGWACRRTIAEHTSGSYVRVHATLSRL